MMYIRNELPSIGFLEDFYSISIQMAAKSPKVLKVSCLALFMIRLNEDASSPFMLFVILQLLLVALICSTIQNKVSCFLIYHFCIFRIYFNFSEVDVAPGIIFCLVFAIS